jgi:phosphatidylinositol alpha-1,6-mannosyltransferase
MRILLLTDDFYPKKGGISHTLRSLCLNIKEFPHKLYIVNPFYQGENIYQILKIQEPSLNKVFKYFLKFRTILYLIKILQKSFFRKEIKFVDKINMILYLLVKPRLLFNTLNNSKQIFHKFKKGKIDLILLANSGEIIPLGFILSRLFNVKLVSLSHGNDFTVHNNLFFRYYFFKYVHQFILSSSWLKKLFVKIHNLHNLEIINRGIILDEYNLEASKQDLRKKYNIPNDAFVLISVGRHNKRKNFSLVIKALKKIKKINSKIDFRYILVGYGRETENLKNLTKKLKLENQIYFTGPVNNDIRNSYYKLSDIFVMPSITRKNTIEGFGIVYIEANYFRLPVIGSESGGIREAIIDGKTGFLIKPNNLDQLVEDILLLYEDKALRDKMGEYGYKRVKQEFNWKKIIYDYIRVFNKTLRNSY